MWNGTTINFTLAYLFKLSMIGRNPKLFLLISSYLLLQMLQQIFNVSICFSNYKFFPIKRRYFSRVYFKEIMSLVIPILKTLSVQDFRKKVSLIVRNYLYNYFVNGQKYTIYKLDGVKNLLLKLYY